MMNGKDNNGELTEEDKMSDTTERQYPSKAKQRGIIFTALTLMLLSLCADTMMLPFFPVIATEKRLSNTEIGIIFSSYDFSRFVSSPIFGSMLIRWHPKSMCFFGNIMTALACIAFGITKCVEVKEIFMGLCILIRLIAGIGSAMLTVSATSILLKSTGYEASTISGVSELAIGLGYTVGPALGAALLELVGYTGMFCVIGAVMLAFIPVYMLVIPKVEEKEVKERKGFMSLLAVPGCFLMFVHCVIMRGNSTVRVTEFSEYMISSFHISASMVGLLYGFWCLVYAIFCPITARIVSKRNSLYIILVGWCGMSVLVLLMAPSPLLDFIFEGQKSIWLTSGAFTVSYMILPLIYVPVLQAVLDLTKVNGYEKDSLYTYGMVTGLINSGIALGGTIGPVIGGAMTDAMGYPWTLTWLDSSNILMVVLVATFLCYMRCTQQPLYVSTEDSKVKLNQLTDQQKAAEKQISKACNNRMNACLNDKTSITVVHEQQPLLVKCQK